jgi:hypothetical protein
MADPIEPHPYVPMGTDRLDDPCDVCDQPAYDPVHPQPAASVADERAAAAPAPSADEHPLPWRWDGPVLRDAESSLMIAGDLGPRSPYVRVVTERAGALARDVRWLLTLLEDHDAIDVQDMNSLDRMRLAEIERRLADIDAAKAAG